MSERLKLGIIGLGRAFTLMLPTFASHPRIAMIAASDPRSDARERFAGNLAQRLMRMRRRSAPIRKLGPFMSPRRTSFMSIT